MVCQRIHRVRRRAKAVQRLPEQILVRRDFHGRLAIAPQVVDEAHSIGNVLPVQVVLLRETEVAVGEADQRAARADGLRGKAGLEPVVSNRAGDRRAIQSDRVLREHAEVVIFVADRVEGRGVLGEAVGVPFRNV